MLIEPASHEESDARDQSSPEPSPDFTGEEHAASIDASPLGGATAIQSNTGYTTMTHAYDDEEPLDLNAPVDDDEGMDTMYSSMSPTAVSPPAAHDQHQIADEGTPDHSADMEDVKDETAESGTPMEEDACLYDDDIMDSDDEDDGYALPPLPLLHPQLLFLLRQSKQ